jgi:primosomal protein N' (replication factor Y) (superfamily II helicase)
VLVADGSQPAVQALIRWDPATFADRELAEREELRFPPAVRMASVGGPADAVDALLALARLPENAEVLGPLSAMSGQVQYLIRVPRSAGTELALSLHMAQAVRTAAKETGPVRIQLDPAALI